MTSTINYDDVFSRFYMKVEAFDFLYEQISEEDAEEIMSMWLRSALAYPYIRKLFKEVSIDDNRMVLTYSLNYQIDEFSDTEFLIELLAYAMVHSWLTPKVNSITNIVQNMGQSDGKFYSQAAHLEEQRALLSDAEYKIRSMIRDRGYLNNTWLDGK